MTELSISITNVGGIDHLEQTFPDSVSIITGSNAANKTSLLQALAFGLGRPTVHIRSGASEARVELEIDGQRVVRTAERNATGVTTSGDGLLEEQDDVELFERFACLLEFNNIRRAVREERSVEELLKEPMNLTALEEQRSELLNRKNALKTDIRELEDVEQEIDDRKRELLSTQDRINELEAKLDELQERQVNSSGDDEKAAYLRKKRASLVSDRTKYEQQIDELEDAIDRLEGELETAEAELEEARAEAETNDIDQLQIEQEEIHDDLDEIIDRVEVLQSVLTANQEMLNSSYTGILGKESTFVEDKVTCWACGNEATVSEFDQTVEELTELVERDKERQNEYRPRLEEIEEQIDAARQAERRIKELESTVSDLEGDIEDRRDSLETKRESLEDIRDDLDDLDERLIERESKQSTEMSDLQDRVEDHRVDLHTARSEADRLESSIDDLQARLEERERKKAEINDFTDEITSLTDRIQTLEQDLREGFNDAINDLIEILNYERIERIWLNGDFDLVVAREVDSVVRQDDVSHLSEGEREMVGLVLALAGYEAYDISDANPVLLMDSLGGFDSERAAKLISYFGDKTPYLVAAVLPDSAAAFDDHATEPNVVTPRAETPPSP